MRQFKLINAIGEAFDLMRKDAFFYKPDGLGAARDIGTIISGTSYIETSNELAQKTVSGSMVFAGYDRYTEFVQFVRKAPLRLGYMPENDWYFLDCRVASLGKTEIERSSGRLICDVDFLGLGAWEREGVIYNVEISQNPGKEYDYTYDYTYADHAEGTVTLYNEFDENAYVILTIFGAATDPQWILRQDGQTLITGKVTCSIPQANKLVVNSDPRDMEISEYTRAGEYVANRYQASDFSTGRFLYIPPGESELILSHSGAGDLTAQVEVIQIASTV